MLILNSISKRLFLFILIWGVIISISSNNPLIIWIGLEINLIAFLPLLLDSKAVISSTVIIKYFLIQTITSFIILYSRLTFFQPLVSLDISTCIFAALIIKIGLPPYHFWLPSIIQALSWYNCLILSTWQKITPLILIISICQISPLLIMFCIFSLIISSLGGLAQRNYRPLIAYSSMSHIIWCILGAIYNIIRFLIYTLVYFIRLFCLITTFNTLKIFNLKRANPQKLNPQHILIINFTLLSIAGLPPFIGFLPKILVLIICLKINLILSTILILSSTINLSFYLNMCFSIIFNITNLAKAIKTKLHLILAYIIIPLSLPLFILYALILLD